MVEVYAQVVTCTVWGNAPVASCTLLTHSKGRITYCATTVGLKHPRHSAYCS